MLICRFLRAEARFLHHEAPVLSSVRAGDHCRGAGRPAAGRLALQIQWSPKYSSCASSLPAFSLSLWLLCPTHAHSLSLSLSLLLHVCLPAASLSMQHVLTVQWHSMLPSIFGVAYSDFPDSPEPSSPPAHPEPGPVHPVSPRSDASPVGPHATSQRHMPGTSSYEPHSTSADVLLLASSDTEESYGPSTQVPPPPPMSPNGMAHPLTSSWCSTLRLSLRIYGTHQLLHLSWWLNQRRMHCFIRVMPPLMILRLSWILCRAINTPSAENSSARWATLANAPSLRVPLPSRSALAFNATPRRSLLWYKC